MIIKVTSPQAPQFLPTTDAEIARVAHQAALGQLPASASQSQAAVMLSQPTTMPAAARPSGCLIAVLIIAGILLFLGGGIYGVYHPVCPSGQLVEDYPVAGVPAFVPHCLDGNVLSDPKQDYIYPGAAVLSPAAEWAGVVLFLWGCILPVVRRFRARTVREQANVPSSIQSSAQTPSQPGHQTTEQQAQAMQIIKARQRVDVAYYCSRDDGFFIPGYPQFFPRQQWMHFLFG